MGRFLQGERWRRRGYVIRTKVVDGWGGFLKVRFLSDDMVAVVRTKIEVESKGERPGLIFRGSVLKDDHRVSDYGITTGSQIIAYYTAEPPCLKNILINVVQMSGVAIKLQINGADLCRDVKDVVRFVTGISNAKQQLVHKETIMRHDRAMWTYGIVDDSTVYLAVLHDMPTFEQMGFRQNDGPS
jgi:hypothetical protein